MKIGLIGAGAIATYLLETADQHNYEISAVLVRNEEKYQAWAENHQVTLYSDVDKFLSASIDIVVEAANVQAVKQYLPTVIEKKNAIVISIGAFVDEVFLADTRKALLKSKQQVYLPSGAIGGLDLIKNAQAAGELSRVAIETRKPAQSLLTEAITTEKVIFQGTARDAIEQYPKNINVSIALSLAGIGFEKTSVKIIADPSVEKNMHTITAEGDFGQMTFQVENNPLPTNPKTSYLAAMSVVGSLKNLDQAIKIG